MAYDHPYIDGVAQHAGGYKDPSELHRRQQVFAPYEAVTINVIANSETLRTHDLKAKDGSWHTLLVRRRPVGARLGFIGRSHRLIVLALPSEYSLKDADGVLKSRIWQNIVLFILPIGVLLMYLRRTVHIKETIFRKKRRESATLRPKMCIFAVS